MLSCCPAIPAVSFVNGQFPDGVKTADGNTPHPRQGNNASAR